MRLRLSAAAAAVLLAGCLGGGDPDLPDPSVDLEVSSSAFGAGDAIPTRFTCDGADASPPLSVAGVPQGAGSVALIVSDPDAPGGTFHHWVAWNLPADDPSLAENATGDGFPGEEGTNDFDEVGWRGPCPPQGEDHRYVFRAYAAEGTLDLSSEAEASDLRDALQGRSLARGNLTGHYAR